MVAVSGVRMAWICTELVALWVVLPILLWTDTLPVVYRIAVLVVAAAYALWIVWFEQVRWDELGFRGLTGLFPSFAQVRGGSRPHCPSSRPLPSRSTGSRRWAHCRQPAPRACSLFCSSTLRCRSRARSSSTRPSSSGGTGRSSLQASWSASMRWFSRSPISCITHGCPCSWRWRADCRLTRMRQLPPHSARRGPCRPKAAGCPSPSDGDAGRPHPRSDPAGP